MSTIKWTCDECGRPVANNTGYIHVDRLAALHVMDEWERWEAEQRGTFLLSDLEGMPDPVEWEVHHRKCDPHPGRSADYWFDVERARTQSDLLRWVSHLINKPWIVEGTALADLILRGVR